MMHSSCESSQSASDLLRYCTYAGRCFAIWPEVYMPESYSVFLAQHLAVSPGEHVLDLTTGCGFHAICSASVAARVVAVDVSPSAVECAKHNVASNGLVDVVEVRHGDLFECLEFGETFDLIVAWPPVFPTPPATERLDWFGLATEGGINGRVVLDRVIASASRFLNTGGRLQLLQPWYTDVDRSLQKLEALGFVTEITATRAFPVGTLSFERMDLLSELGFPLIPGDSGLTQLHSVVTGHWG